MKALLAKTAFRRGLGIYVGEGEIAVSQVAATATGVAELVSQRREATAEDLPAVLAEMLAPLLPRSPRQRAAAVVGLAASRVFFATRPLRGGRSDLRPELLLQKALQSPTVCVDEFVVEMTQTLLNKSPLVTLAACRRKHFSSVLGAVEESRVRVLRAEPAPVALMRAAALRLRGPRRAKVVVRVFLGQRQGLAVVAAGNVPLAWRNFPLLPGVEATAILSAVRTLQTLGRHYGIETPPDVALVHGRQEIHERLKEQLHGDGFPTRLFWCDGPAPDAASIAFGLALGGLKDEPRTIDLARTLKPPSSIWEIMPWGELAVQASLVVCMALLLTSRSMAAKESYAAVRAEKQRHQCLAKSSPDALEKERQDLQQKTDTVRRFVETRVTWTSYLHDLPERLPKTAALTALDGVCELQAFSKKKEVTIKPKKSFIIRGTAPIIDSPTPREIPTFLAALRNHPLLTRDFPIVELADIKYQQLFVGGQPLANFTVLCLPKDEKGKAGGAAKKDAEKDGKKGKK